MLSSVRPSVVCPSVTFVHPILNRLKFSTIFLRQLVIFPFPCFRLGGSDLQFVSQFKYLGHIITHNLSDDNDMQREIRSMFVRCNVLKRKFSNCSLRVKVKLFQSYCMCFYDIALWSSYHASSMCKFRSCYNKCLKLFFRYKKYDSTTKTLLKTGLPSFDTVCANASFNF